jgi:hypothetical protein
LPSPVSIDLTPPIASITTIPSANAHGWINSTPVSVNFSASDSGSGVQQLRYWINNGAVTAVTGTSAGAQISGEGTNTAGLRALDNAGNISPLASAAVNTDLTAPSVSVTGVTQGAIYNLSSVPAAGCNTTDALSGVASNATVGITGGNGHGEGQLTATCSGGTDNAGNLAPTVAVTYDVVLNVSPQVHVSSSFKKQNSIATLTVRNTSPKNIFGPIQLVLTNLTSGVSLSNATGAYLGSPYITVAVTGTLGPGKSLSVQLQFNNPGNVEINFSPVTFTGQFN